MRITKRIFTDLALYMSFLGVIIGIFFPFFVVFFKVPRDIALTPVFFTACILAGVILAVLNIGLARRVVGSRIKQLSQKMKHVEGILSNGNHESGGEKCTPENCRISVDSEDELGESAESFNRLIFTLSDVMDTQADIRQFSEMLTSHLELSVLADEALKSLVRNTQASGGAILIENYGEFTVDAVYAMKNEKTLADNPVVLHTVKTLERQIIQFPQDIVLDGVITDYHPKELIIEPIIYKQVLIGVILLAGVSPFTGKTLEKLSFYGPILSMAFNNAVTHQQMQRLAALDSLTGIYNRRFGIKRIQEEFSRSIRYGTALSLLMLDIDHFKNVNDTYGHMVGDKIIVSITKTILGAIREGDVLIRYGGEEFLCVLPGANHNDAAIVAERIRVMVSDSVVKNADQEVKVTVSVGTTSYPYKDIANVEQFIKITDEAMYTAKNTGRNRVVSIG